MSTRHNWISFLIGVVSSIVAALILYYLRYQLNFIVNILFSKVYPNVSGVYSLYFFEMVPSNGSIVNSEENDKTIRTKKQKPLDGSATNRELLEYLKSKSNQPDFKIKLTQFANKIKGETYEIEDGIIKVNEKLYGKVTPSRIILLNSETKDENHHDFGTYLLTLENDSSIIKGTSSHLCIECGNAASMYILLEKHEGKKS